MVCCIQFFLFKIIDFCIFTPKTLLVKENYFLTLWNFTYLKDTSFGKKSCNFEHGLETKNEFEKWPLITFFQCTVLLLYLFTSVVLKQPSLILRSPSPIQIPTPIPTPLERSVTGFSSDFDNYQSLVTNLPVLS